MFSFNSKPEELNVDIDVSPIDKFLYEYQTDKLSGSRRSQTIEGIYYRNNTTSTIIDIKVENYPADINDFDTNTGLSWKQNKGIANITLSGKSIKPEMPIISHNNTTSFIDLINILKFYFGVEELKMNLTGNNEKILIEKLGKLDDSNSETHLNDIDVKTIEKDFTQNILTPTSDKDNQSNIYISFKKSCPTKWVRVKFISLELDDIDFVNNLVTGIKVKLIIDGLYLPRLSIKVAPANKCDSLLVWNEKDLSSGYLDDVERFSSCRYVRMVRKQNSPNCLVKIVNSENNNNKKGLVSKSFNQKTIANIATKDYIYFTYTNEIYKINNKEFINDVLWIETVVPISEKLCNDHNTEVISFIDKKYIGLCQPEIFIIDYIRDRFAIFQFIATLSDINKNRFTESFLRLVKSLSGVYIFNDLLYYYNLIEFYNKNKNHHSEEYMRKVFHFIADNMYFYTTDNNITVAGTVLKDIYSISSRMNLTNYERLSGINTDLNIEYPEDWCHMNKITESGKTISLNTTSKLGIKKIFFQNCGVFDNNIDYCFYISYTL